LLGVESEVLVEDDVPLNQFNAKYTLWFQDLFAPFFLFNKVTYQSKIQSVDDYNNPKDITLTNEVKNHVKGIQLKHFIGNVNLREKEIKSFEIVSKKIKTKYLCTSV
jgi:hypothetical protein